MIAQPVLLLSFVAFVASAFSQPPSFSRSKSSTSLASYLDSLGTTSSGAAIKAASYGISGSSFKFPDQPSPESFQVAASPALASHAPESYANGDASLEFPFAPAYYFSMEHLVSKGPRTADWGTPIDGSRKLCDDGTFRAGAWFCTEGGWQSPNQKAHTEVFYVLEGYGCLEDSDGVRHYFGPGDNVVIPKGHTGRWDVNQPIRKVWAVNDHENIEELSNPIRVQVDHYNSWAPQFLIPNTDGNDPLYGFISEATAVSSSRTFYDVGPNQVGVWSSKAGGYSISNGKRAWIHILEGVVYITNGIDGSSRRCVAGDTIVLPAGWYGHVDVIETTKKLWTVAQ